MQMVRTLSTPCPHAPCLPLALLGVNFLWKFYQIIAMTDSVMEK